MAAGEGGIFPKITPTVTTKQNQLSQWKRDYTPGSPTQFKITYKTSQVSTL